MAIKIPNTLEPTTNDFPVVNTDHIGVNGLNQRTNLTNYLETTYEELFSAITAGYTNIRYDIKNTTDRVKISVSNITATTANVQLEYKINTEIENISTTGGEISLKSKQPTIFTVNIQNKLTTETVYSKSIEIMRKAPIYVGHSSENITVFDTEIFNKIFNKNYLTDSLHGECEIPANSWQGDAYLYIAIPKAFFGQKTVQTTDGTENIDLQLLQNGFPVGSKYADTDNYFIYRSSQMISEHSTLEFK